MPTHPIFSIGHSSHSYERFLVMLETAGVTAVADVRSAPYSRQNPQFNRETLKKQLQASGIAYSFLGNELGGRPSAAAYYRDGVADYERMAADPAFQNGIDRLLSGAQTYHVVLMCSERDPLDCHRCLLVSRSLAAHGVSVQHIAADGTIAPHESVEERLLQTERQASDDLFRPREERLCDAYRSRARKVAYAIGTPSQSAAAE